MTERLDEMKGIGEVTGDEDLRAEGEAEATAAKVARETKGVAHEVVGTLKEGIGNVTGDETTKAEGKVDRLRGKADRLG